MTTTSISGIWLRTYGKYLQVLVERDGYWYAVITEYADIRDSTISHIVEPIGVERVIAHNVPYEKRVSNDAAED